MSGNNRSKTTVRKCNIVLLSVLYYAVRIYCFFCGIRIKKTDKTDSRINGPAIVICNHGSFIDFIYAASLIWKSRPHFVVARLYFYHTLLGGLLRVLGCFPKSMFATDIESVKNCVKVLKSGEVLVMMPEARLSTAGKFEDIQSTTYAFLKKSGVPVYAVKLNGNYFADPKWGKGMRKGSQIEAELDILFTPDELCVLSEKQIADRVEKHLYYDEFKWLKQRPDVKYRSRRIAEGLENILAVCPLCKQKHTITAKGRDIFCENCGKLVSVDCRYGFSKGFVFENFGQWYDWQKELLKKRIEDTPDFVLASEVELRLPGTGNALTRSAGRGVCTLDRSGLHYDGTRDGKNYNIGFSLSRVYRLLFGAGKNFEIYNGSEILYFVPDDPRTCVDWYLVSMLLYDEQFADKL